VVLLAARLAPTHRATAIALAAAAYILPGMLSGTALAGFLYYASPSKLIATDSYWRAMWLCLIAVLATIHMLELSAYIVILAVASTARPISLAGERVVIQSLAGTSRLHAANSLIASTNQLAAISGPLIAGAAIAFIDPQGIFVLDAATFVAYAMVAMRLPPTFIAATETDTRETRVWHSLRSPIATLFWITFAFYFLYGPTVVALPLYCGVLAPSLGLSTSGMLGGLWAVFGTGALLGTWIGGLVSRMASVRSAILVVALWGAATVVIGVTRSGAIALAAMFVGGLAFGPYAAITATILQHAAASAYDLLHIGSLWGAMTSGATPLGILLGGAIIPAFGVQGVLVATGASMGALSCLSAAMTYRYVHLPSVDRGKDTFTHTTPWRRQTRRSEGPETR
jgi:hypothetical protein